MDIDTMRDFSLQTKKNEQNDNNTVIHELKTIAQSFVDERDWQQFHSPKNLAISVAIEAAELMEIFQWHNHEESVKLVNEEIKGRIQEELADVLIYCLHMAYTTGIDITSSILQKIERNEEKYPKKEYQGRF